MTDNSLTIQAFLPAAVSQYCQWQDIAELSFNQQKKLIAVSYLADYSHNHFLADNHHAIAVKYPVELFAYDTANDIVGLLAFLDDIIPAGASRKYWLERLDLTHLSKNEQDFILLQQATIAPIGHLRIKQAVEQLTITNAQHIQQNAPKKFSVHEVINRDVDFLEYANEQGAMAGGATGAGGEAPKLLLRCPATALNKSSCFDSPHVWIDSLQQHNQEDANDSYYLVKYPRNRRSAIDCDILRAEYHYYQELQQMGFNTIDTDAMQLLEGDRYPSLWLPRFDIVTDQNGTKRYAMESVYSMLQKGAGAYLKHQESIRSLIAIIENSHMAEMGFAFDKQAFVVDWLRRDLLNITFGNSDNHGRNTAFLRDEQQIWLAPIYDFAPMKADPEGIVRSIKWRSPDLESGGDYRFDLIAEELSDLIDADILLNELNTTAQQLAELASRLAKRGVPTAILEFPSIGFDRLADKLVKWGLTL